MYLGIPQAIATLLTVVLFYTMDFALIRRYDKKDSQAVPGAHGTLHFSSLSWSQC